MCSFLEKTYILYKKQGDAESNSCDLNQARLKVLQDYYIWPEEIVEATRSANLPGVSYSYLGKAISGHYFYDLTLELVFRDVG